MKFSPLFWPVELKGKSISIIDETALPAKVSFIKVTTVQQACRAIKEMKTRAVGQVLLVMYTFLLLCRTHKGAFLERRIEEAAGALNATRPTLPFKVLTDMVRGWSRAKMPLEACIQGFLKNLEEARIAQAEEVSGFLRDKDSVLTHCHVSGLMPLIGEFCRAQGRDCRFVVTETRPYLQGMRLTAWELKRQRFAVTLICDSMVALLMRQKMVQAVIVGADHLAANGDIANKVGTYQIAVLAKHFNIPFYVLCPPASSARSGEDIVIEERPAEELYAYTDKRAVPRGVKVYYPAFDVTPGELVTRHIYLKV